MASVNDFPPKLCSTTITFADQATASSEADLAGTTLVAIVVPASMTTTTLTFTAAPAAGGTHVAIVDSAKAALSFTIDNSAKYINFTQDQIARFEGVRFLKLVSSGETGAKSVVLISTPR